MFSVWRVWKSLDAGIYELAKDDGDPEEEMLAVSLEHIPESLSRGDWVLVGQVPGYLVEPPGDALAMDSISHVIVGVLPPWHFQPSSMVKQHMD